MANNKIKKVTALFDYIRRHNDELSFNKNDIITLTQQIDGGWWEGTLDQITGWFPSNYVTDFEEEKDGPPQSDVKTSSDSHLLTFQADIVNHILDGEKKYVSKLSHMLSTFLIPSLKISDLNECKVQRICDSLQAIIPLHKQIIEALEEMKSTNKNRVGRLYLDMASKITENYYEYSSVHLFVIYTLEVNKLAIQSHFENQRMVFDWSQVKHLLSLVFDRLSRYSLLLKEMERYLEDGHPDRGDIQRAIVVYTEINEKCNAIRKKKDRDLDILCANILGWKGERLSQLGDPILTIKVSYIGPSAPIDSHKALNHVVVVMPICLILLACTEQADIYTFKSKLALENLSVYINSDECNIEMRSELTGEYLHLICDSPETRNELVLSIKQASLTQSQGINGGSKSVNMIESSSNVVSLSSDTSPIPNVSRSIEGKIIEHLSTDGSSINISDQNVALRPKEFNIVYKPTNEHLRILRPDPPTAANLISCSQQIPVTRSSSGAGGQFSPKAARRKKEEECCPKMKDDALVLQVIESYCVSSKGSNSLDLARIRLSDAEIIRSSNNWVLGENASKQPRNLVAESVRGRESSGSSNTTASGENNTSNNANNNNNNNNNNINNPANRRLEINPAILTSCQLNIRGHERGGCACVAQSVTSKPTGCAPMISGRNKKKS